MLFLNDKELFEEKSTLCEGKQQEADRTGQAPACLTRHRDAVGEKRRRVCVEVATSHGKMWMRFIPSSASADYVFLHHFFKANFVFKCISKLGGLDRSGL